MHSPETSEQTAARIARENKARSDSGQAALTSAERAALEKVRTDADAKRARDAGK